MKNRNIKRQQNKEREKERDKQDDKDHFHVVVIFNYINFLRLRVCSFVSAEGSISKGDVGYIEHCHPSPQPIIAHSSKDMFASHLSQCLLESTFPCAQAHQFLIRSIRLLLDKDILLEDIFKDQSKT